MPNFWGKIPALMAIHRSLGLAPHHLLVQTILHRPTYYSVRLDLHSHHERMAFLMDGYEWDTVQFLLRIFDPSGCFLDVGGNIGLIGIPFTLLASRKWNRVLRPERPITYCLEPVRSNYESLCHNMVINQCEGLLCALCTGVGETEKTVEIQVEGDLKDGQGTGTANIMPEQSTYKCERIPLQISTIDDLIQTGQIAQEIKLIKLDTDGYDFFALMGAGRLLREVRPVIFGEFMAHCLKWHGQTISDVVGFAETVGYKTFVRIGRSWQFALLGDRNAFLQDALLVPQEQVQRLSWCLVRR
jgi:FkbM family methyltransferase